MTGPERTVPGLRALVDRLHRERSLLLRVLRKLGSLSSEFDPDQIRVGLTEAAVDLCGGEWGFYLGLDEDESARTSVTRLADAFDAVPALRRAPLLAAALRGTGVTRIDDTTVWAASDDEAAAYGSYQGSPLRSYLAAPVVGLEGESTGAMFIAHRRPHAFTFDHELLAEAIAAQLGAALANAARHRDRMRVTAAFESSLLPPLLPAIPGVAIAARYRAAGEASLVGGDFYDVFRAGERWCIAIGDVCGIGPEAAALTGLARYTIRATAPLEASPAGVLVALNQALLNQNSTERFLSAVQLTLEVHANGVSIHLARGGHPLPVVLRDQGGASFVEGATGPILGVFDTVALQATTIELGPGDSLVLYTDGVTEARRADGDYYGDDRLLHVVSSCAGRTADGIARRIELSVIDFVGGRPHDDAAIVVVQATARRAPAT